MFFSLLFLIGAELMVRLVVVQFQPVWRDKVIQHGLVAYPDQWKFRSHPFLHFVGNHNYLRNPSKYNLTGFPGEELDRQKSPNVIRMDSSSFCKHSALWR